MRTHPRSRWAGRAAAAAAVALIAVSGCTGARSTAAMSHTAASPTDTHSPTDTPAARSSTAGTASPTDTTPAGPRATGPTSKPTAIAPWSAPLSAGRVGHLAPGSHPAAMPTDLLIADKLNNRLVVVDPRGRVRWVFPRPGDLAPGQSFRVPDDAFFSPDGRYIVATQEDQAVISVIDVARHRIIYRYGKPGVPGSGANRLSNPDDAMMLPNGYLLTADIMNCRLLLIAPHTHRPARVIGRTTTACWHHPPRRWGSPNGVFPMTNGQYLVTEINGDWVDAITLRGKVAWSTHPPGVNYPSDSNEIAPGRYLTVDYSSPGQVVIFDRRGHALWRYTGTGRRALNHPSLALPLPNGYLAVSDDYDHRVIVINPRTKAIVWQYGVDHVAGRAPGYLNNPDGLDAVPPDSLLTRHRNTLGSWPPAS